MHSQLTPLTEPAVYSCFFLQMHGGSDGREDRQRDLKQYEKETYEGRTTGRKRVSVCDYTRCILQK